MLFLEAYKPNGNNIDSTFMLSEGEAAFLKSTEETYEMLPLNGWKHPLCQLSLTVPAEEADIYRERFEHLGLHIVSVGAG